MLDFLSAFARESGQKVSIFFARKHSKPISLTWNAVEMGKSYQSLVTTTMKDPSSGFKAHFCSKVLKTVLHI